MASILSAHLRSGDMVRAESTLRRLGNIFWTTAPELRDAHNMYLEALVAQLVVTGDQTLLREVHAWFHVRMLGHRPVNWKRGIPHGVRPDAYTIALMVRASLVHPSERTIARTVRYYLRRARHFEVYDEAKVAVLDQLSNEDAARVMRYDPDSFRNVKELVQEACAAAVVNRNANQTLAAAEDLRIADPRTQSELAVRTQDQKGLGLTALKQSLSALTTERSSEEQEPLQTRQRQLEKSTVSSALDRWRKEHDEMEHQLAIDSSLKSRPIGALLWSWHKDLVPLVEEEMKKVRKLLDTPNTSRMALGRLPEGTPYILRFRESEYAIYGPFMRFISPEKLSATTILATIHILMAKAKDAQMVTAASLFKAVGRAVEEESQVEAMKLHKEKGVKKKLPSREKIKRLTKLIRRARGVAVAKAAEKALKQTGSRSKGLQELAEEWPAAIVLKIGAFLVSKLLDTAKISVRKGNEMRPTTLKEPALNWQMTYIRGHKVGHMTMHSELQDIFRKEPMGSAIAKHLPMLIPPKPWQGYTQGGFLNQRLSVVRMFPEFTQTHDYCRLACKSGDMDQLFAGLDILGRTKWKVNRRVFDVMLQVWNTGKEMAGFPPADFDVEYPDPPPPDAPAATLRLHKSRVIDLRNLYNGMHSNRCFANFQMEVAKAFLNDEFYLPHNLDFRGRAYPIPPYFNHMGADNCRGLMLFGEGKPLGPVGLYWLRIQLANVYGFDKASLADRQQWTIDHMDDVRDSTTDPLGGRRWWLKAEDPWQCLATCFELNSALNSPNPEEYVSHLPVHQDGTCNGLQHYAALGGDELGARQVNLEPGSKPSDIYTAVAQMVAEDVAQDVAQDLDHPMAKLLHGKISRKIVKQTVMTNVYGVTKVGAQQQVCKHLEDVHPEMFALKRHYMRAGVYVASKIFAALAKMFNGASAIQDWLGESGARISMSITPDQINALVESRRSDPLAHKLDPQRDQWRLRPVACKSIVNEFARFRSSIIWTTPLKMPVVQPYRKHGVKRVETHLQGVHLTDPSVADPVDKRKQLQAFAPNFIHSLDATHMMLSALACHAHGLTFASVHDSFWTHAADVPAMNRVLRDAFVRMHAEDIMGRLAAEFAARYRGSLYLAAVPRHSPLGRRIAARRRAPAADRARNESTRQVAELIEENRRQRLLRSDDPAARAEAAAMHTAASLWEAADKETDLIAPKKVPRREFQAELEAGASAPAPATEPVMPLDEGTDAAAANASDEGTDAAAADGSDEDVTRSWSHAVNADASAGHGEDKPASVGAYDENADPVEVEAASALPEASTAEPHDPDAKDSKPGAESASPVEASLPGPLPHHGYTKSGARRRKLGKAEQERVRLSKVDKIWLWLPLDFPPVPAKVWLSALDVPRGMWLT